MNVRKVFLLFMVLLIFGIMGLNVQSAGLIVSKAAITGNPKQVSQILPAAK